MPTSLTAILISRFFLDLREAATGGMQLSDTDSVSSADVVELKERLIEHDLERLVRNSNPSQECRSLAYSEETAVEIQEVGRTRHMWPAVLKTVSTLIDFAN